MSCGTCERIREKTGEAPDCEKVRGCRIPPITTEGQRILEIRNMLMTLRNLTGAGPVLEMHHVTASDLKVLAMVEQGLIEDEERED